MTLDEVEDRHKNLLTYDDTFDIDCPESDIVKYRATLGHKANHKFDANTKFCFVKSPRYLFSFIPTHRLNFIFSQLKFCTLTFIGVKFSFTSSL